NFFDKNYGILMCFDTSNGNVNFIVNDSLRMQEFYIYKDKRDNIYTSGSSNTCPSKFDFSGIRYEFIKSVNNGLTGINSDGNALILNKNITLTDSTGLIIGKSLSPFGTNSVKRILTDRYNQFYIYGFANDTIKFGGNKFFMENFIARITIYNPTTIIKEIEKPEQTSFYPNPCSTTLNITSNFQLNSIAFLINIQGEILSTITLTDGNNAINVSTLPKGIYLLKIQNKESVEVRKFVKE
ncbi:MAG: T9SS type A sorting domain-containing protein, partial [Bacteroidetes bacterium]|nr:T9SS type A sorting domain-containing protein [Bacteroidota bacterium]